MTSLDKEVAEWLDSIGMVWGEEGNVWYLPDKDGPVIQMSYYAAAFFYTVIKRAELKAKIAQTRRCYRQTVLTNQPQTKSWTTAEVDLLEAQLNNSNKEK